MVEQNTTDEVVEKLRIEITRKINRRKRRRRLQLCLVSFVLFLGIVVAVVLGNQSATIYVEANSLEIFQDSEKPEFNIQVTVEGKSNLVLDKDTGYTVESLREDIEEGIAIGIDCELVPSDIDGEEYQEGTYVIDAYLAEEYQEKLSNEWKKKIRIEIVDGNIEVKNKLGYWEDDTFISWDSEVVKEQWISSQGDTYYIDQSGHKLEDTQLQVGLMCYTFDSEGKLISSEPYIDPDKPTIAITYDDGPSSYTYELLEVLESYDVHATFFMQGASIKEKYQDTLIKMLEIGCELGNHSTTHADLTKLSSSEIEDEMDITSGKIEALTGELPTVMRPPYGAVNQSVKDTVDFPIILWNVDTEDWKTENPQDIVDHILEEVSDGDIILMHDTKSWTVEATEEVIPLLIEQGYQIVTVSELAEVKGVELQDGVTYRFIE